MYIRDAEDIICCDGSGEGVPIQRQLGHSLSSLCVALLAT